MNDHRPPQLVEDADLLATLSPADDDTMRHLHDRLVRAAAAEEILDVAYRIIDSPVGSLLLASTERGLVRVAFAREDHDRVLDTLADRVSPRVLNAPARLELPARELDEYFGGSRTLFDVPLDLRLSNGFRRDVLSHLRAVAYGRTTSYASLARAVGNPKAVRAVGSACATNPLPVFVPCHRVLRSDGRVGGYVGGVEAKSALLALEAAV